MAKDYKRGADYKLYLPGGTPAAPTFAANNEVKAAGDIDVNTNPDDISVPERGGSTGHLQGEDDPAITFTLFEDAGNANVTTLVNAMASGAPVHIAVARGDATVAGTKYWALEARLAGVSLVQRVVNRPSTT